MARLILTLPVIKKTESFDVQDYKVIVLWGSKYPADMIGQTQRQQRARPQGYVRGSAFWEGETSPLRGIRVGDLISALTDRLPQHSILRALVKKKVRQA